MNGLMYLLQVNLYLLLFYLLYLVLLRNETFFRMNRFYLVGSALLSLAIPLIKAGWIKGLLITERVHQVTQQVNKVITKTNLVSGSSEYTPPDLAGSVPSLNNLEIITLIYGTITMMLLLNLVRKLYLVNRALKSGSKDNAFSFFKKVVVDQDLDGKEIIMNHEMVHVKQWHSLDVIFFEIFAAFNWFNPIVFLYKKAIKNIHEFIADETAASTLEDRSAYTLLLVSNVFGAKPQELTNSFFNQSLLKRRIIMLHKTKSRQVAILKYGLSVPLFALMIIISSATIGKSQQVVDVTEMLKAKISTVLTVVATATPPTTSKNLPAKYNNQNSLPIRSNEPQPLDYRKVDVVAEFPGGVQSLYEWFKEEFEYPQTAMDQGMEERMVATFIVEKDGSLSNIKIIKDAGFGTDVIALKLLQKSPKWIPAQLNGTPVRMSYNFPVNLKTSEMYTAGSWALKEKAVPSSKKDTVIAYFDFENVLPAFRIPGKATYPGGLTAFNKYLISNLKFPAEAKNKKVTGSVTVSFSVNKDGTVDNIEVNKAIGYGCDEEAIRLIQNSGKWNPAKYDDGTPERTGHSIDIIFQTSRE